MIEINLIPKGKTFKTPTVLGIDIGKLPWKKIIIFYLLYAYLPGLMESRWEEERSPLSKSINKLKNKERKIASFFKKHEGVEELLGIFQRQIKKLEERSKYVDQILKERTNPYLFLKEVAKLIPQEVWFDKLEINEKREILINGGSHNYKSIGDFLAKINNSPFLKEGLQLKDSKTVVEKQQDVEARTESFTIQGKIDVFDPFKEE